jgi:predicted AlkP superfamily phosphohydrolase/phosphomutase
MTARSILWSSAPARRTRAAGLFPLWFAAAYVLIVTAPAEAYIGPGAGFALLSSVFVLFLAILSALLTLLTWPVRWVIRALRGRRAFRGARARRLVILGLDGLEPSLVERFMAEGKLPNFSRLREMGSFSRLGTATPPLSPVAWSCFLTGVNPGKHNIFDFLNRDKRTYLPNLSSVRIRGPSRTLKLGPYRLPLGKPEIKLLRGSRPFWNVLGDHNIPATVLRVPITWPPEKFRGVLLSAMCVPDLRGSQGMFSFYTTNAGAVSERTGGEQIVLRRDGTRVSADLIGPENDIRPGSGPMWASFHIDLHPAGTSGTLHLDGETTRLERGRYTPWLPVTFRPGLGVKVRGICQFLLLRTEPHVEVYVTPINIDPEKPAMPVAYPTYFSTYLSKRFGPYATLGLAEDTWSLNEGLIGDDDYLHQCVQADEERERMWFDALKNTPQGLICCVFDGPDRIQHMFWRYIDEQHPANPSRREGIPAERGARRDSRTSDSRTSVNGHGRTIEEMYVRMDRLVGQTMEKVRDGRTVLMVISDHGFNAFRRGIDLNRWLIENSYMALKPGGEGESYLRGVDWTKTRAFALGLAGMWINQRGREAQGIVDAGEAPALRSEIAGKLARLKDPDSGETAIRRVMDARDVYVGPYRDEAPDLIVGYNKGYRVDWNTAIGKITDSVFHDNTRAWSGDHCVDPEVIPGVLFCNRKVLSESPRLMDLAATALDLFGVPVPEYMDGRPLQLAMSDAENE